MNATFTNVAEDEELLARVVDCWASLYGERVISYRASQRVGDEPSLAVVVQQMIPSERSGVMFTVDPSRAHPDHIIIEAAFGQGEVVVSGQVEPDTYVVERTGPALLNVRVGIKTIKIVQGADGHDQQISLDPSEGSRARPLRRRSSRPCLSGAGGGSTLWVAPGRRVGDRGRTHLPRPIETHHDARRFLPSGHRVPVTRLRDRGVRGRTKDPRVGVGCVRRSGVGPRQGASLPRRGRPASDGGDPGGVDDQSGLGPHHATSGGSRDRRWRHDVSRRHRDPRARRAVRRGGPQRHHRAT